MDDATSGWLAINVWHNLQYVLVVWMVNVEALRAAGVDADEPLLSRISQPGRVTMSIRLLPRDHDARSTLRLNRFTVLVMGGGLAATLGIYMGINFHHYIVDALIWKRRQVRLQAETARHSRWMSDAAIRWRRPLARTGWPARAGDSAGDGPAQPAAVHLRGRLHADPRRSGRST